MFRKINNVFRPNHHGHRGWDDGRGFGSEQDYHSACTVRLVRSTSMLVVGEKIQTAAGSTLKRSKSTVSIESTLYYYQRQEDRMWLYSQNQNCLEYLEALVALRRQYIKSVSDLKSRDTKATVSSKKKPAPPPPHKEKPVSLYNLLQNYWQTTSKTTVLPCLMTDIKSQTLWSSSFQWRGHPAVFWRSNRQLWQRTPAETLHGWWTRGCGFHRWVWDSHNSVFLIYVCHLKSEGESESGTVLKACTQPRYTSTGVFRSFSHDWLHTDRASLTTTSLYSHFPD